MFASAMTNFVFPASPEGSPRLRKVSGLKRASRRDYILFTIFGASVSICTWYNDYRDWVCTTLITTTLWMMAADMYRTLEWHGWTTKKWPELIARFVRLRRCTIINRRARGRGSSFESIWSWQFFFKKIYFYSSLSQFCINFVHNRDEIS